MQTRPLCTFCSEQSSLWDLCLEEERARFYITGTSGRVCYFLKRTLLSPCMYACVHLASQLLRLFGATLPQPDLPARRQNQRSTDDYNSVDVPDLLCGHLPTVLAAADSWASSVDPSIMGRGLGATLGMEKERGKMEDSNAEMEKLFAPAFIGK